MSRDFLASQIRTNQIIASRSFGFRPSLMVISASNANGSGAVSTIIPAGSDAFVFVSGSRGTDAYVVLGGSAKISGSLSVFDDVNLGQTTSDSITFLGRIASDVFPSTDRAFLLGQDTLQWKGVFSNTGSFDFLSSSDNGLFFKGLSGSLQRTAAGIPYLNSGTGITISTASNGQITIASVGVAGGIDKQVQFNDMGILEGDDGLTYNKTTKTLSVGNLFVTGSVTAVSTSNLTISDAVIYLASGAVGPNARSVIAFASGSSSTDKSLIFGSLGANDTIVAARQDVSGGIIAQSNLSFTDLVPIRASKFEIGTSIALTSSDGLSTTFYSAGSGFISIVPGSVGLKLGNSSAPVAISGSNVRIGATSSEFSGEIPPLPGSDVYFFVSGSRGGKGTSGVSVFGGDAVVSGSLTIGTGSITISSNEIKFLGGIAKIYSSSNGLVFEDSSGTKSLSSISTGGGGGGDSIFTAATSNSAFTTSSIAIGIASAANTRGSDVFYYVSGTVGGLKKSLFEGDVISSGSFSVKDSSSGATKINLQNSGVISGSNELQIGGNLKLAGDIIADRNSARNVLTDVVDITIGGAASTIVFGGDIQINGNDIKSGTGAIAITLNGQNVSAPGNLEVTGSFSCNGNITLGDATSDNIVFAGRVNSNLSPSADMARDLGSPTSRWRNIYTGDLHLRNDRGNWTIIEEEDFLTIINNLNGKKYKFVMEEI